MIKYPGANRSAHLDRQFQVRVARSGEEKESKRRGAENADLIPLVVLRDQRKGAHHVDGTNND